MVSFREKLNFLEGGVDFPFYNDIPRLSRIEWLMVLLSIILFISILYIFHIPGRYVGLSLFLVTMVPALYICKGDYGLFFKKVGLKDFKTIILCLLGYYAFTFLVVAVFLTLGISTSANAILESFENPDLYLIVATLIQLLAEEFYKIFILLIVMHVAYRKTGNRNLSVWAGIIATMLVFALSHASAYDNKILQILMIQGVGTIFSLYPYLKTKNVVASYILHIIMDFIPFLFVYLTAI